MYLSTIVISEFQVRQPINDLPLRNFIILPFNVDHAMACGLLLNSMPRDEADDRVRVKDDFKLMAQCECEGITHLFCEDAKTLAKYVARRITSGGPNTTRAILMKDGFDGSCFDNGQAHLPYE